MSFTIHSLYGYVFKVWREKRFQMFLDTLQPSPSDLLLDVGGYPGFWVSHPQPVARIDALNVHEVSCDAKTAPHHQIRLLTGDGCALSMESGSYDIGFSNSVIEHVGSWEQQQRFASEIRRVGKALWVQTPARECPLEPHYMAPLVHYLPRSLQKRIVRWGTPWGWIQRPSEQEVESAVETTRLLRKAEMRQLFPDCEIVTERMLGFIPKSYIAVRRKA